MQNTLQLQAQIQENSYELNNFIQDLGKWEDEVKNEDKNLKMERRIEEKNLPPVRSVKKSEQKKKEKKEMKKKEIFKQPEEANDNDKKSKKIKAYEYDKWHTFDVDAACAKVDEESEEEDEMESDEEVDLEEEARFALERKVQQASLEKEKGNQLFKEGKYEAAINRYTQAITVHPTDPIFYANRAMSLLKVERYGAAEADCTLAVELDPDYTKAYMRRATARHKMNRFENARIDYQKVLELEPKNKQATSELAKVDADEKKYKSTAIKELSSTAQSTSKKQQQQNQLSKDTPSSSPLLTESSTKQINEPKRKIRSSKPLKRVKIEEVGFEETDEMPFSSTGKPPMSPAETKQGTSKPEAKVKKPPTTSKVNDRVPPVGVDMSATPAPSFVVPNTSFQFESHFRWLQRNPKELYQYLKIIPTSLYSKLFANCIDNLVSPFVNCFFDNSQLDHYPIHPQLVALSNVPRFKMAIAFLSNKDKQLVIKLLKYMNSTQYPSEVTPDVIADIAERYGMKLN